MQNHVTNQEISKRLKELGIKQESIFSYQSVYSLTDDYPTKRYNTGEVRLALTSNESARFEHLYSAFLLSELGEILYNAFDKHGWNLLYESYGTVCNFEGTQRIGDIGIINLMRNPDIAGLMLIYLKENNLI